MNLFELMEMNKQAGIDKEYNEILEKMYGGRLI